jgi:aspartate/tyrosine/aromatic aminotransferase
MISRQRFHQLLRKNPKLQESWSKDLAILENKILKMRENLKNKYEKKLDKIKDKRWIKQKKFNIS